MTDQTEGWAWPSSSRKAHYFRSGRSLCGHWSHDGELVQTPWALRECCRGCWHIRHETPGAPRKDQS